MHSAVAIEDVVKVFSTNLVSAFWPWGQGVLG